MRIPRCMNCTCINYVEIIEMKFREKKTLTNNIMPWTKWFNYCLFSIAPKALYNNLCKKKNQIYDLFMENT